MILMIIFWILWFLWILGCFCPLSEPYGKGHKVLLAVLIGILGYRLFGNPMDK